MTKIYLNFEGDSPEEIRLMAQDLLGLTRKVGFLPELALGFQGGEGQTGDGANTSEQSDLSAATPDAPKRERGKPAQGKSRRTAEEVAEDKAADEADAARVAAGTQTGAEVADRQISTSPEDRVDAEQDAVDEAAETAAAKAETGGKKTLDDVRGALGKYVESFGMDAAQAEGPQIITMMFGSGKVKVSDIPDTDKAINAALDTFAKVTEIRKANPEADFAGVLDLFKKQAGF